MPYLITTITTTSSLPFLLILAATTTITTVLAQTNPPFELAGTMGASTCTGTVSNGAPHAGLTRAYIIDKSTCEAAATALGLSDNNGADITNKNNKWMYIPGCHWDGTSLYVDPTGLHGQRTARTNQQALCALVEPCVEGQIIPEGQQCACTTGVTYHTEGKNGNYADQQTVLCSVTALTDTVYCGSTGKQDKPKEVRCYPDGIGCAASPYSHFTKTYSDWAAGDPLSGDYVWRGREINDFKNVRVASFSSLQIVGLPFGVEVELYKNWNVDGWNPGGTRQKCYPDTTLPRLRGVGGAMFSVEESATLTLRLLELAGVGTLQSFVVGGAVDVRSGTFIGDRVWFNGWNVVDVGGAIHAQKIGSATFAIELKECEFGRALTIASTADYGYPNTAGSSQGGGAIYAKDLGQGSTVSFICTPGKYRPLYVDNGEPTVVAYDDADAGCTASCPVDKGYYAPTFGAREQESDCGICPAAYYCPDVTSPPTACPLGRYAPAGSHSLIQCAACFPGKYVVDAGPPLVCGICAAGMYRNSVSLNINDICMQCPSGRFALDHTSSDFDSSVDKSVAASFHDAVLDCLFCEAGTSFTTQIAQCDVCGAGHYQSNIDLPAVVCQQCPEGRYLIDKGTAKEAHDEMSLCLYCPKGNEFVSKTEMCSVCKAGHYQDQELQPSVACQLCPTGRYLTDAGVGMEEHDEITDCFFCNKGEEYHNRMSACSVCQVGQWQDSSNQSSATCQNCPSGQNIEDNGIFAVNHDAVLKCSGCLPGQYLPLPVTDLLGCVTCPGGYYQAHTTGITINGVSLECVACREGTFIRDDAGDAEAHDSTKDCILCAPGQFSGSGERFCSTCPAGYYTSRGEVTTSCVKCDEGQFQKDPGKDDCDDCDAGRYQNVKGLPYCLPCVPGRHQPTVGKKICVDCLPNLYTSMSAQIVCLSCGEGKSTAGKEGSSSCTACPPGEAGTPCTACLPGTYRDSETQSVTFCDNCPAGYYQDLIGQANCLPCIPGTFSTDSPSTSCKECGVGTFSTDLAAALNCIFCPAGFDQMYRGKTSCSECVAGKFQPGTSEGTMCQDCEAGMFAPMDGFVLCEACRVGQYGDDRRMSLCKECGAGQVAKRKGMQSCTVCPEGYYSETYNGNKVKIKSEDRRCALCPSGFSSMSMESSCRECALGKSSTEGGTCTKCNPGYYRDELILLDICADCPKGSNQLGSTYCSSCDAGRYNDELHALACKACKKGRYQDNKRSQMECKTCKDGYVPNKNDVGDGMESTVCVKSPFLIPSDCLMNQYLDDSSDSRLEHSCKDCILGADCSLPSTKSTLRPLEGYRPLKGMNSTFGRCPAAEKACPYVAPTKIPGALNLSCAAGHDVESELCSTCLPNYASVNKGEQCSLCPTQSSTNLLFAGTLLFAVCIFSFLVWDNLDGAVLMVPKAHETEEDVIHYSSEMPFHSIVIRLVSSYLQIAGMLLKFDLSLPEEVRTLVRIESSGGALGEQLLLFDCGTSIREDIEMFQLKQIMAIWIFPAVGLVCCAIFWIVYHIRNRGTPLFVSAVDGFISSTMVLFFTLFPSLVNRLAMSFSCEYYGNQLLVSEALGIKCFSTPHLNIVFCVGIPGFIFFVFMIPSFLSYTLIKQRRAHKLFPSQHSYEHHWTLRFGFVYAGYKEGWEWWETIIMLRKCTFVMLAIFLRQYGPSPQVVAAAIVLVIALSAHLQHQPYHDEAHTRLESIGLHACLLVLLATLLANLLGRDIDLKGRAYLGPTSTILLSVFVFASTIYFFSAVLLATIRASQHTKGFVGNLARQFPKICGKKMCARQEKKQMIRLQKIVRASLFNISHQNLLKSSSPPPLPSLNHPNPKRLPPMPSTHRRLAKVHPTHMAKLAQRAVSHHHVVQDVSKGMVKAIAAAEDAKHIVEIQQHQQHERLQKRLQLQNKKRNKIAITKE